MTEGFPYFSYFSTRQNKAANKMVNGVTITENFLEVTFGVAEFILNKLNPNTSDEEIIAFACNIIV